MPNDRHWVGFPITDEMIRTHQLWIRWCYLFCRETERVDLWDHTAKFYSVNPDLKVPLPTHELYKQ